MSRVPFGWRARGRDAEPEDAAAAIRAALVAVLEGDTARAEALLTDVVRRDSTVLAAYLALALLFRRRGELGRAIHLHQNLLLRSDADPDTRFHALLGLAEDFRAGGFLRRAIAAYEEVLRERPDHPEALRALVALLTDAREPRRAIPLARRLARLEDRDPGPVEAALWVESAEIERAEGRPDAARRALARALRRDAGCVRAWVALGELEAERGRTRKALAAWRRVPVLDRRAGPAVYPRVAATLAALGRSAETEQWLRALLEEQPDDIDARLALARAFAARDAVDEAIGAVRAALERDPDRLDAHRLLGRLLLAHGRSEEAAKAHAELLEVLERRPDLLPGGRGFDDDGGLR